MKTSARKDFEVYEFKDEEQTELISNKLAERFSASRKKNQQELRKPKLDTSPLRKYQFLKTFSSGSRPQSEKMSFRPRTDVDASDSNYKCRSHDARAPTTFNRTDCVSREDSFGSDEIPVSNSVSHSADCAVKEGPASGEIPVSKSFSHMTDFAIKEGNSGSDDIPVSNSVSHREDVHSNMDSVEIGNPFSECPSASSFGTPRWSENILAMGASSLVAPSYVNTKIDCNLLELQANGDQVDVISDGDDSESCSSDIREDQGSLEGLESNHYPCGWEKEAFVVRPDYLIYKDLYCTTASLSFSCSSVKFEGVNAYGRKETCSCEWGLVDVIAIESQWHAMVEMALVKLYLRPTADLESETPDATAGDVELKFAVCDPCWFESQEKIRSMDDKYKAIWRELLGTGEMKEDAFAWENRTRHSKPYYPIFGEAFEDVIYPKGDPDAVSISKRDVELLQPETFINDTIIDFYIKYLKNEIRPEDRIRFHFFNSFFFRKLADLDKNPSSASEGRAAFLRVRKWTRKVNLFEKDYVFIPVNYNLHWSLIVVCHPGEVATFKDEECDKSLKVPCILHMDSFKGSHKGLQNLVQSYLWEEWKERQSEPSEDVSSRFLNLRFLPLELPQQENMFDCGLFLLHYVELFLEMAPANFNPFKINKSSNFLNPEWFKPSEASLKRTIIQKLIYRLLEDHSEKITSVRGKECQTFRIMENNNEKGNGVDYCLEGQIAANCNAFSSRLNDDQGIEIKLLGAPGAAQLGDSGLVLKDLFEPGTTVGSIPNGHLRSFDPLASYNKFKAVMTPIKEDEEAGDQMAFSPSGRLDCQQLAGYTVEDGCTNSYPVKDFGVYDTFSNPGMLMGLNEDDRGEYFSSDGSSCGSQSSCELVEQNLPVMGLWCPSRREDTEFRLIPPENNLCTTDSSASGCSEGLDTRIVEDSQEVDKMADDDDEQKVCHSPCRENSPALSDHCKALSGKCGIHLDENRELSDDANASKSIERAAKRVKLTLPLQEACLQEV